MNNAILIEIQARRSYLIRHSKQNYLTETEHNELHELSQQLIDLYAKVVDLAELSDAEINDLMGVDNDRPPW